MAELGALLQSLRNGEMPALDLAEVEALVGWLLGKGDEIADLPKPEHDPVLQQMVFYRLDATLFSSGELRLVPAGLGPEQPMKLRKTRFRRLAGAFHPDRHPDLADWLTERSQAVLRAYGRFKQGDDTPSSSITSVPPYRGYAPPRPPRRGPFRRSRLRLRAAAESLRQRFGNDRFLPHKLIGALALIAMLPVLNLLLVPEPAALDQIESAGGAASYSSFGGGRIEPSGGVEVRSNNNRDPISASGEAVVRGGDSESAGGAASYSGPEQESSKDSALLAAARDALRLGESETAHLPSVDEQLAAMGLDTDTERLYRRIRGEARQRSQAAAVEASTANSRIESAPTTAAAADSGIEAPASVGVDSIRDIGRASNPPVESHSSMQLASTAPTTDVAADSGIEAPASVGVDSSRDMGGASNPPVESHLPMQSAPTTASNSPMQSAPTTAAAPASVGVDSIRDIGGASNAPVQSHSPMQSAPTTASNSPMQSAPTSAFENTESPGQSASAAIAARSVPELAASELTLGLLSSHPAGAVLRGYADAIEAGNLIALLTRFDRQARHGSLRGSEPIARHYQALFDRASPRRIVLKVLRVESDDGRWKIETELRIEGVQADRIVQSQSGRATFTLGGAPLRVQRLEF